MYALPVVKMGTKRQIVTEINESLKGKNILLVEDLLETGTSLNVTKEYLEQKGANVKTACLYTMPQTRIVSDYSLVQVSSIISFPWE